MTVALDIEAQPASERAARICATGLATLSVETAGMQALSEAMAGSLGEAFAAAVETIIATSGRVVVTGMGKSGHVGNKIAATMASTGTPTFFLHPAEASHGDLGMLTAADVVLALSWSGGTAELRDIIHYTRRHGVKLIALTGGATSALAKAADILLLLPPITEACPHGLAPTTSTLIQMAMGDALAMALLDRRGFRPEEFAQYHPGGKLGAQLMTVSELMQKAPNLPLVEEGAEMSGAILAMTGHSLGCAVVVASDGRLVGLVTDGDLRRHMHDGILKRPVTEVMTPRPLTTEPGRIASAALKEMNARKVSQLVVLEDGRPVGVLHLHHLLSAGVA